MGRKTIVCGMIAKGCVIRAIRRTLNGRWRSRLSPGTRYYNDFRTHRSLDKDAPVSRAVERFGSIKSQTSLGRAPPPLRTNLIFGIDRFDESRVRHRCSNPAETPKPSCTRGSD
jgi:hypothetical protein